MAGKWTRRAIAVGAVAAGAAAVAGSRLIPMGFLKQYWAERGRPVALPPKQVDTSKWTDRGVHAAWLGHSTVLLRIDGMTVLTDPVFSEYAGLGIGPITVGVKRLVNTPLVLTSLPKIDLIVISHAHMDHLDVPTLRALENKGTHVVMASSTSDLIRGDRYGSVTELGWGQRTQAGAAEVTAFEVSHWGARMRTDTYRGYNGYVIKVNNRQVLFAGDTAMSDTFRALPNNAKPELAIFPIGAYNPWIRVHCNPEQAWRMANDARAEMVLPVHHKTFRLSSEPLNEPLERLHAAAGSETKRIGWTEIGDTFRWS